MTRGGGIGSSPSKNSKKAEKHTLNFPKLLEINRAIHGTQALTQTHSVSISGSSFDLQFLYSVVKNLGGFQKVNDSAKGWKNVVKGLEEYGLQGNTAAATLNLNFLFKHAYEKYLLAYEKVVDLEMPLPQVMEELKSRKKTAVANGLQDNIAHPTKRAKIQPIVIEQSDYAKFAYRGPNPDEDGKDEKYLNGGFLNRLTLAIKSNLPNEQDWAFNKLIKLSASCNFNMGHLPGLLDSLLDQTDTLFSLLQLNTSPMNFETSLVDGAKNILPDVANPLLFSTEKGAVMIERTLQVFHILRNMSFIGENVQLLVRNHRLLTVLAKSLALPSSSYYTEIQQHALDIFENMAIQIPLRGHSDFYLACLLNLIIGSDKARILGAVKALIRLTLNEKNEKIMAHVDTPLLQRLLQLLLVPDEEIVMAILEFFYLFTNISTDSGLRIASAVRFNVLRVLFKFVHWRGMGMEVYRSTIPSLPSKKEGEEVELIAPPPKAPPPNLPETAVDHFHAALWISTVCDKDPSSSASHDDFYEKYVQYCEHYDLKAILLLELLKLVSKISSESSVSNQPPLILGLRPRRLVKKAEQGEGEAQPTTAAAPVVAKPAFRVGNYCGYRACRDTDQYLSRADLWEHVLAIHNPKSAMTVSKCPWNECGRQLKNPGHLLSHLKTHIIPDIKILETDPVAGPSRKYPPVMKNVPASSIQHLHYGGDQHQDELKGIPLTALLVLRNMARNPGNHVLFAPFEEDLACLLTSARFGKTVASIFAELR